VAIFELAELMPVSPAGKPLFLSAVLAPWRHSRLRLKKVALAALSWDTSQLTLATEFENPDEAFEALFQPAACDRADAAPALPDPCGCEPQRSSTPGHAHTKREDNSGIVPSPRS